MSKANKSSSCKIHYDSEFVSWTIHKANIENALLGKKGLLFLDVESAGEIEFKDSYFGNINNNPNMSVAKPGKIISIAAKVKAAPETIS